MPDLESTVRTEIDRRSSELTRAKRLDAVVEASRQALLAVVPRLQPGLAAATAKQAEIPPRPARVWADVPRLLTPAERNNGDKSYGITLRALEERGIIRAQDAARLRRKSPPVVWAGDPS